MKLNRLLVPISFALFVAIDAGAAKDRVLYDFGNKEAIKSVEARGVELALAGDSARPMLEVRAGADNDWPTAVFGAEPGLDLSSHGSLVVPLRNPGGEPLTVHCRIDSLPAGAGLKDKPLSRTWHCSLDAGERKELAIPLEAQLSHPEVGPDDFFGMRGIPFFNNEGMHLERVTAIMVFVFKLEQSREFQVGNIRLQGDAPKRGSVPARPFPIIDGFGQFKHAEWPGKTHSVEDMRKSLEVEEKQLAAASPPASWNRFGGWKDGPDLGGTGWFRTAKHGGKWQLVDPDGRLFFSLGIDCVRRGGYSVIDERRHWFESLPADDEDHRPFYGTWTSNMPKYHFFDRKVRSFSHHRFNLWRKYGEDWESDFWEMSAKRLPIWGVNTIANWSDAGVCRLGKLPYVISVNTKATPIAGSSGYWGKFSDVFHPEFRENLRRRLAWKEVAETREDPMCIGYFIDNELSWGDELSLATASLASPPKQPAKLAFVGDLKAKYGSVAKLNEAWKAKHGSWQALLDATEPPDPARARADLLAFYERVADQYFSVIREEVKKFAPHHLYLGCRFAWTNPVAVQSAARHCDVVSFNAYTRKLETKLKNMEPAGDKPYIIGEFHFGALDRGMLHTGLIAVEDQAERAGAFSDYVNDCLDHPNIVGCHWFQYSNSPTTGRWFDGENYQIGFTDTCDTPYPEIIAASRAVGEGMYRRRAGRGRK